MVVLFISIGIAETIVGGIMGIIGVILGFYLRRRSEQKKAADEWYREALGLIARCQKVARRATEYQDEIDAERFIANIDPLAEDMKAHAADAPSNVPQQAKEELNDLADLSTALPIFLERIEEQSALEFMESRQRGVEQRQEQSEEPIDIDDVRPFAEAINLDGVTDQVAESADTVDEEIADRILSEVSDETAQSGFPSSIEEVVNFPFEEVEELLGPAMEATTGEIIRLTFFEHGDPISDRMEECRERL